VSFHEPNPDVRPTGAEGGEFADDGPLAADELDEEEGDPTRRPTGSPPLAE
jgi:hypothetical protein